MKKLTVLLLISLFSTITFSQEWINDLPQEKLEKGTLTFYEIQDAFNAYWKPYNVEDGYYINEDGERVRAPYWKQFKRWEWYWENRVDKKTGAFPKTSASEEFNKWEKTQSPGRSITGDWESIGPDASPGGYAGLGRLNCVAFHPQNSDEYYVGSPSGGIWKTDDDGSTWTPIGDDNDVLGVSDIILINSVTGPDILYIATGDRDGGSMWSLGGGQSNSNNSIGVLKSTDGGDTWQSTGLSFNASQKIRVNRLLKDPNNNNTLYAATTNGLYKTTDAGDNWTMLTSQAFIDMEFKPGNPSTMYGSTEGWTNSKIYYSTNGGSTWTQAASYIGRRTQLGVSADEPAWVYAVVCQSNGGLKGVYKSTDNGQNYSQVYSGGTKNLLGWSCDGSGSGGQGTYDLCIIPDPNDANTVYVGGVNTWKSTDGGSTFSIVNHWSGCTGIQTVHADKHYFAFQNGTSTLFEANDGGLYRTSDGGSTWAHLSSGMATSQIYRMGVGQTDPGEVIIGLQDNGTKARLNGTWTDVIGGDGFECFSDYTDKNTQYGSLYYGQLYRTDNYWASSTQISGGISGNGWWITPWCMDPADNQTLYAGFQDVWKSTNKGNTWTKISNWNTSTLRSLAVAPSNSNYIYTAEQDVIYKTTDGGSNWSDITGTLPVSSDNITYIGIKDDDPNTVWVTLGGYNSNAVFESVDGGSTWTNISTGLPQLPAMSIRQNKQNSSETELYVGMDVGVYVKIGSADWTLYSDSLPNVVVTELDIYYDDTDTNNSILYAATYGRGVWKSDLYGYPAPTSDFSGTPTSGVAPLTVDFTDESIDTVNTWAWYFGDGGTSSEQNPQYTYNDPGTYTVSLKVTGPGGYDSTAKTDYITVDYPAPTADFVGDPTSGVAPLTVDFTDQSLDSVNAWSWYFGDGSTSTEQNPQYTYNEPGTYTVSLVASGPGGSDSTGKDDYITVDYPAPTAEFSGDPTSGIAPLTVDFTDESIDSVNAWIWYFGDGNTATEQNPQHTYNDPGDYTVSLKVTGPGGSDSIGKADYITVNYPAPTAEFMGTPTSGSFPLEVSFTDQSTGNVDAWKWYFGDGETASEQNPDHTYQTTGTYSVALRVDGPGGTDSLMKEDYINVTVGIKEFESKNIKIYPNPFGDYFTIHTTVPLQSVSIVDMKGNTVYNKSKTISGGELQINTEKLLSGLYYCRIIEKQGRIWMVKMMRR